MRQLQFDDADNYLSFSMSYPANAVGPLVEALCTARQAHAVSPSAAGRGAH